MSERIGLYRRQFFAGPRSTPVLPSGKRIDFHIYPMRANPSGRGRDGVSLRPLPGEVPSLVKAR